MKISISNPKLTDTRRDIRYLRMDITFKRTPDEHTWTTIHACTVARTRDGELVLRGPKCGYFIQASLAPEVQEHVLEWLAKPANMARYGNKVGNTARLLDGIDLGGGVEKLEEIV